MARSSSSTPARPSRSRGAAAAPAKGRARQIAQEAEEFVEVTGGDFNSAWDFDENNEIVGVFKGTEVKEIKKKDRTLHTIEVDGEDFTVWGTAVLDNRLEGVEPGSRVKIVRPGTKIRTKSGHQAWEFKVFVSRGAFARNAG